MPGGHVLVGEARGDVKHDDGALPVDVVPVPEPPKLLLPCRVPAVEAQLASVCGEVQRVHLHPDCGCTWKRTRAESENMSTSSFYFFLPSAAHRRQQGLSVKPETFLRCLSLLTATAHGRRVGAE